MAQYQSFPDAAGDSRTLDKLKALRLPDLAGKSFLDVGCNEGFFCGFAKFSGAGRVVGLDKSRLFAERAQRRFPDCEFVIGDWDALPAGPFDVVLLASAIHYASDQPDLIRRLVELLSHDGVLVIEMGLVSSEESEWRRVKRGDDERMFPSMRKIEEVLSPYAWKWMGPSVDQSGDPVSRHVLHVMRRRPVAYLLMQPPGYGKSTIAKGLAGGPGVPRVSGDELILRIARKQRAAPDGLHRVIARDFSPFRIDAAVQRVFQAGLGEALVKILAESAQGGDFALDMYVPEASQAGVENALVGTGYLPVRMVWDRAGPAPQSEQQISALAASYFQSLAGGAPEMAPAAVAAPAVVAAPGYVSRALAYFRSLVSRAPAVVPGPAPVRAAAHASAPVAANATGAETQTAAEATIDAMARPIGRGYVDTMELTDGRLLLTGWAVDAHRQQAPLAVEVHLGGRRHRAETVVTTRRDVQRRLELPHADFGYHAMLESPLPMALPELLQQALVVAVWADSEEVPLRYSTALVEKRAGGQAVSLAAPHHDGDRPAGTGRCS